MLKKERQQLILDILDKEKRIIASDLSHRLNVSEDTIRRDLRELDKKLLIRRVHSGALRIGPPVQDFQHRIQLLNNTKIELAEKAIPLLQENSVIMIDGGTTNMCLVNSIPLSFHATIITNSPPIATSLAYHNNIEVINLGGILYKQSMVNLGIDTIESLDKMRADIYIMGVHNIDPEIGLSVPTLPEAQVKRKMASISSEIIGLVTANKLGTCSNQIIAPAGILTYLVTDKIDMNDKKEYASKKIIVIS